jgi:hypothetical protein
MRDNIDKCPFCGNISEMQGDFTPSCVYVRCPSCDASGPKVYIYSGLPTESQIELAISLWNARIKQDEN